MAGRPIVVGVVGAFPLWATATNYATGPYAGLPTKVNGGSGFYVDGWTPGVPPAAETKNFYRNLEAQFLSYLDQIDALNFPTLGTSAGYADPTAGFTQPCGRLVTYDGSGTYWAVSNSGGTGTVFYSHNGQVWVSDTASLVTAGSANVAWSSCDSDPVTGIVLIGSVGSAKMQFRRIGATGAGSWITAALTGSGSIATYVEYDRAATLTFLVASGVTVSAALRPAAYSIVETSGTTVSVTALTLVNANNYTLTTGGGSGASCPAFVTSQPPVSGGTLRVALFEVSGGAHPWASWSTNSLASSWTENGYINFASSPVALTCNDAGLFMVVCANGQVYVSTDGLAWTLQSTGGATGNSKFAQTPSLASHGSQWAATTTGSTSVNGTNYFVELSDDNGQTWTRVNWPFDSVSSPVVPMGLIAADGRFVVSGVYISGTTLNTAQSLKTR